MRAVELDEGLAEAHTALAVLAQDYDWDWQTAEKEYRRAIQLDPNYATAHHWYGEYLGMQGRFDEAFHELEHARQLDPLSLIIAADKAVILYYSRDYGRSIEQFRAVLEMEPNFPRAYLVIGPYAEKGMFKEALAQMDVWEQPPFQCSTLPAVVQASRNVKDQTLHCTPSRRIWSRYVRRANPVGPRDSY